MITSTWPILSRNMVETGVQLMKDVFTNEPIVQRMFSLRYSIPEHKKQKSRLFITIDIYVTLNVV